MISMELSVLVCEVVLHTTIGYHYSRYDSVNVCNIVSLFSVPSFPYIVVCMYVSDSWQTS